MKSCHNYSNFAQSQILFDIHQQPMVPGYGNKYEGNPSCHHREMCKDRQMDGWTEGWTGPVPIFPNSA